MAQQDVGIRVVVLGAAQASRILGNVRDDLSRFGAGIASHTNAVEQFGRSVVKAGDSISSLGRMMTYTITTPVLGALGALTSAGINFEDAFAGVSKTVGDVSRGFNDIATEMYGTATGLSEAQKQAVFANDSFGDLTELGESLRNDFRQLSREIPVSAAELANIGQVAGQLGVRGREQLVDFTKTVAQLGVATDLSAEQAAFALARMGNIMGIANEDMGKFAKEVGNSLVALGNTSAATETEIVNLAYRISGAARAVGLTMQEVLGISAALAGAGIKAEMGGSAVSRIFTTLSFAVNNFNQSSAAFTQQSAAMEASIGSLQQAISSGVGIDQLKTDFADLDLQGLESDLRAVSNGTMSLGEVINGVRTRSLAKLNSDMNEAQSQLQLFARAAGMSEQALASLIRSNPTQAFQAVLAGISRMQEEGTLTSETLNELELNTIRLKDVIMRLGPNMDQITEAINTSNTAWTEQIALQEEATKRFKTMKSLIQLAKNALTDLGITIFDLVKDDLAKFVKGIGLLVDGFQALDPAVQKTIIRVGLLVSALGPLLLIGGTLLQIVGINIIGFGKLQSVLGLLIPSFNIFGKKQKDVAKGGGIFGALFGNISKTVSGALGSLPKLFTSLGTGLGGFFITSFIGPIKSGIPRILKAFTPLFGGIANKLKDGFLAMKGLAGFWVKTFQNAGKGILATISAFLKPLGVLAEMFASVLVVPIQIISKTFTSVVGVFGKVFTGVFSGLIGVVGKLGGKLLSLIPVFGKFLFSGILGTFTKLPLIIGGILALLFAPKVIKAVIKNRDALFDELKVGFKQFGEDVKNLGLEKSILLFFSGGSTGSGRRGGIYGIAKALGASEDSARKFSYAMGTAAVWVIKIVKDTKVLVSRMVAIATASDRLGTSTKSTSDRLSTFAGGIAKFLEGFSVGWLNSFDNILDAFSVFVKEVKRAVSSVGGLFDAIFGGAKKAGEEVTSFTETLEPGAENTAMSIGMTVGDIIGGLVTLTVQALTFITTITGVVANALTGLVTAYREGGVVGVFEELGPLVAEIFNGFIAAAGTLWTEIEPSVSDFISSFTDWMINTGGPALWAGAKSMFGVIRDALDSALFGTEETVQQVVTGYRFEFKTGAYAGEAPLDYMNDIRSPFATNPDQFNREEVFGNQVVPAKEGLIAKIGRLIDDIQAFVTSEDTKEKLRSAFRTALGALGDAGTFLWEGGEGFAGLRSYLNDAFNNIAQWFENSAVPRMRGIGRYLWQELTVGLLSQASEAASFGIPGADLLLDATGLGDAIDDQLVRRAGLDKSIEDYMNEELSGVYIDTTSLASSAGVSGSNIGKSMTDGIRSSITTEQTNVNTAVNNMATGLVNTAKGRLDIKSPSKVFYGIGRDVISGMIIGLKETSGLQMAFSNILTMFSTFGSSVIATLLPVKSELVNFMSLTSQLVNSVGTIVASVNTLAAALAPTSQQINTLLISSNSLLNSLNGLSGIGGLLGTTQNLSTVSNSNTSVYSPTIYGPSPNTVQTNNQLYNNWLFMQGTRG